MLTYKFRLYPNKEQQSKLWTHANKLNWMYNTFLEEKIQKYKQNKKTISKNEQQKEIKQLVVQEPILEEIHSQVRQQVTDRLDKTYKFFFKRGFGFPRFRSCKKFFGITYPQSGFRIEKNSLITKVYGKIKFIGHRKIQGEIKRISITTKNNKWFLCVTTDYTKPKIINKNMIGIDLGQIDLVTTNTGKKVKSPTHAKYFDKQIGKLQQRRSKLQKKSRKYNSYSRIIRKLYDVKNRKINDFLHKVSCNLSRNYDTIFIENLNSKKMSESKATGLNRENRNSSFSTFISYLEYKINKLLKVNPRYTSQTCSCCGNRNKKKLPLTNRTFTCESCNYLEDRDINAAKNIYLLGTSLLGIPRRTGLHQETPWFSKG